MGPDGFNQQPIITDEFNDSGASFPDVVLGIVDVINSLIPVLVAVALLVVFWGAALFILKNDDRKAKEKGRRVLTYGVIGMFVIAALWGIILFISSTFGIAI